MTVPEIKLKHKVNMEEEEKAPSKEIDSLELDVAATLGGISVKLLEVMSTQYRLHNTMVRFGQNLDVVVSTMNNAIRDFNGIVAELRMRVSDLEALRASEPAGKNGGYTPEG